MLNPFGNFNSIKVQLNVKCFNPRTHVGCDSQHYSLSATTTCFNPRTHVGCDLIVVEMYSLIVGSEVGIVERAVGEHIVFKRLPVYQ